MAASVASRLGGDELVHTACLDAAFCLPVTLGWMHPDLTPISGIDELDVALRDSRQRPLLLFKHSYSCGISAEALDELLAHLAEKQDDARYAMVTVQTHRDVSNAIASRLGVRHETPQALLVRDGEVIWSASHFRVNAREIRKALSGTRPDGRSPAPRPTRTPTPTEN